jgi:hypothetical protein
MSFKVGCSPLFWISKLQPAIVLFNIEAKDWFISYGAKKISWLQTLLKDFSFWKKNQQKYIAPTKITSSLWIIMF